MRPCIRVEASQEQEATLKMWDGSWKAERRLAMRAKVVLLSLEGLSLKEISQEAGLSWQACLKWRKRFLENGLDGLTDKARRGRSQVIGPQRRVEIIALACTEPGEGCTRWSVRKLAEQTGHSKSLIQQILSEASIKPHKTQYWCGKSPDPEFEAKQAAIVGLYLSPPEKALVLCVDEKSQIQALDRTQPKLPLREGQPKRLTATYKRNGTTCLLAALAVHQGEVTAKCVDSANSREFLKFLKRLYRENPGREMHVIVDNLSSHKQADVMDWVARRRRLTMHFTPTYSSWLNQIEIWFNIFTRDVLRGGVWPSKKALVSQIMAYIKAYNGNSPKPFKWTYTGKPLAA